MNLQTKQTDPKMEKTEYIRVGLTDIKMLEAGEGEAPAPVDDVAAALSDVTPEKGHEVIMVSSGAVAAGRQKLGLTDKRRDVAFKQVLASVGQNQLMQKYEQLFSKHKITTAQALLTKADLTDRAGYLNGRNTLLALLELRVICIVNENDVVATDELGELKFGDNDNLSAMVANLVDADLLAILTDIDGLYTADPAVHADAGLIQRATFSEVLDQRLRVMDSAALIHCMENDMPILVFNMQESGNIVRAVRGDMIGSLIADESYPARG